MINDKTELIDLLNRVMDDYRGDRHFFEDHHLPEYAVLGNLDLDDRTKARYLTFTCVTNHIHDGTGQSKETAGENGLWWVCARLLQSDPWAFDPAELVGENRRDELKDRFDPVSIMDERDPEWWYRNAKTLYREFDSDPRRLLAAFDYDAPAIQTAVSDRYDFPSLGGRKVCPLWLRLMHDEIHPLEDLAAIDIPVDFHIVNITGKLRGEEFDPYDEDDKRTIRQYWRVICDQHGFTPVHLDIPIWLLNKYWNDGGARYVAETLAEIRD